MTDKPTARINLHAGTTIAFDGKIYSIDQVLNLETLIVRDESTGVARPLKISEITKASEGIDTTQPANTQDLLGYSEKEWDIAKSRFIAIKDLIESDRISREAVSNRAQETGHSIATLYRWIKSYRDSSKLSSLVPSKKGWSRGRPRVNSETHSILDATISEVFLSREKKSLTYTYREVVKRCKSANIPAPHYNTVRSRVLSIAPKKRIAAREGYRKSSELHEPIVGAFPGADWPLSVVQIDHTKVDIILVDDIHRRPIGRPWITLAIDVFSRMVTGFYISFDPPNAMAVGLCVSHSVLPKENWLAEKEISASWPIWGIMDTIHVDNAKEFRGRALKKSCEEYTIDINWRPVARPHFGGHIERLLGTFSKEIHNLPGSTFSNLKERGIRDPEKTSALTLSEFERWLSVLIVEVYHQKIHSELKTTPLQRYEEGILGNENLPGRGLPDKVTDEERLRLDFMPFEERTIQRTGITIDNIEYFDNVLRPWINAVDRKNEKLKRKFIVRRDPRNISRIHFFDPELRQYFEIPYRNTAYPPMSIWELREIQRKLRDEGRKIENEETIFKAYDRMRTIEDEAKKSTKRSRRAAQRRKNHEFQAEKRTSNKSLTDFPVDSLDDIQPYDEIEILC